MCLQEISSRIYWMPGEECTDRPVLGYIRGEKYALQIDAGASPAHLAKFQQELKRLHLPAAHGEDNVIVLLPEERFAFLGDAPCGDFYHLDGGYDPALLSQMIGWMEALPFGRCCTGHGQPENKASLLEELRQEQQAIFVQPAE